MTTLTEAPAGIDRHETDRLEAFSDGVFAIAITLLVLELVVPKIGVHASATTLRTELGREWPSYLSFVTSFATILIMWINHHEIFRMVDRVNTVLLFTNGLLLLCVTVVPFPTAIVGEYLATPAAATASAIYAGVFLVINVVYNIFWWSIRRPGGVLRAGVSERRIRTITRNYLSGLLPYAVAVAVAFWSPYASMGVCFGLWILWGVTGHSGASPGTESQTYGNKRD